MSIFNYTNQTTARRQANKLRKQYGSKYPTFVKHDMNNKCYIVMFDNGNGYNAFIKISYEMED